MISFEAFFSIGESCQTLFAENRVIPTICGVKKPRRTLQVRLRFLPCIWQKLLCFQCDAVFLRKTERLPVATPLREDGL